MLKGLRIGELDSTTLFTPVQMMGYDLFFFDSGERSISFSLFGSRFEMYVFPR